MTFVRRLQPLKVDRIFLWDYTVLTELVHIIYIGVKK